ncbi:hypothetical protein V6N11_064965 [Hibiscus sabdariffa]|uniref:Uncharacterized protein n=1 Tax=Hibiscus sabdariffa TaxID=183260 RepID=A0ABR2SIH4_9ROSI
MESTQGCLRGQDIVLRGHSVAVGFCLKEAPALLAFFSFLGLFYSAALSPPSSPSSLPSYGPRVLERALFECGNNVKRLQELHLGTTEAKGEKKGPAEQLLRRVRNCRYINQQWRSCSYCAFKLLGALSVDDAKARAFKLLEVLKKSISRHIAEEASQSFHS